MKPTNQVFKTNDYEAFSYINKSLRPMIMKPLVTSKVTVVSISLI